MNANRTEAESDSAASLPQRLNSEAFLNHISSQNDLEEL